MSLDALLNNNAPAAVRRPTLSVRLGDDVSDYVTAIRVEMGLFPAVDGAVVLLRHEARVTLPTPGDLAGIALGYDDTAAATVFSGHVISVERTIAGAARINLADSTAALARLRLNRSYVQQDAGQIVEDLLNEAGAEAGTIAGGVSLAHYAIHSGQRALDVITDLARKSGHVAYCDPEGAVTFETPGAGSAVQTFVYGSDIVSLRVAECEPLLGQIAIAGEGAAGSSGDEAWSWLVKDTASVTGTAGQSTPADSRSDAGLRSAEAAQQAADGLIAAEQRAAVSGVLVVPGAPVVTVASTIDIEDVPTGELNGSYLVRWIRHRYDKHAGFTSTIGLNKAATINTFQGFS